MGDKPDKAVKWATIILAGVGVCGVFLARRANCISREALSSVQRAFVYIDNFDSGLGEIGPDGHRPARSFAPNFAIAELHQLGTDSLMQADICRILKSIEILLIRILI
jgi:hypothetical protein